MCSVGFDGDRCPVWNEPQRRARKAHRCDACGGLIRKGETYVAHSNLFDGAWTREAMCLPCLAIRTAYDAAHEGLTPPPSALEEILVGCIGADRSSEWLPHLDAMRARREADRHA